MASILKEEGSEVKLAKVDCTEEKKLFERFDIKKFPTIKLFKRGISVNYKGIYLSIYHYLLLLFTQKMAINEGPSFLAILAVNSNFHHRRSRRGIELGALRY